MCSLARAASSAPGRARNRQVPGARPALTVTGLPQNMSSMANVRVTLTFSLPNVEIPLLVHPALPSLPALEDKGYF